MVRHKKQADNAKNIENILHPLIKQWFYSRFSEFSLPQKYAVLPIHSRKNILVSAPTGATKTLTGFLSILNELVDSADKGILADKIYCVYISPLKALNYDIEHNLKEPLKEIEKIAKKKLGIRVAVRTGDTTAAEKSAMLKKPPHILITTPESLAIMLSSIKFKEHLRGVEWAIIDEIHALAENKRGVHLSLSMERLERLSGHLTRVGLSATISPIEEVATFLAGYADGSPRECTIVDVQFIKELELKVLSPVPNLIDAPHSELHHSMYTLIHTLVRDHKTTLIFTNTRAATERVVHNLKEKWPTEYTDNIGAHHGSLSKEHRHNMEQRLREGKLKVVVSSTSLELGIDIGFIDLVILLGSPKSVARALQRIGRSGHKLHEKAKGRIIVLDRDDLVECAVLVKAAHEKKIDTIHIPQNALDVLSQQIDGIAIEEKIHIEELYTLVKQSYCYRALQRTDFMEVIKYLSGEYTKLEDRYIYAKIWYDEEAGMIGRKGKMGRVIYMTNIGTIPDESYVTVKAGEAVLGKIDEGFLERLRPGDIFVLGGQVYRFKYARGMTIQVDTSVNRPPTVPSWFSEMLPLSFDLANAIGRFRRHMDNLFTRKKSGQEISEFIDRYLYVDSHARDSLYHYFYEQFHFDQIPSDKKIVIESYNDGKQTYHVFHTLYGRRVNDVLSRAIAFAIGRVEHRDVAVGINDNGFYISAKKKVNPQKAFKVLTEKNIEEIAGLAIDKSEVLKRRFRHCAARSFMILRNYKGRRKNVGKQQMSSGILMNAVKQISPDFSILKEARREVLEDLMDIHNAKKVLKQIKDGTISIVNTTTQVPSPFAFNLIAMGYTEILKIEDRTEFIRRMHAQVLARIGMKKQVPDQIKPDDFSYQKMWDKARTREREAQEHKKEYLTSLVVGLKGIPMNLKEEMIDVIEYDKKEFSDPFERNIKKYKDDIKENWPTELKDYIFHMIDFTDRL